MSAPVGPTNEHDVEIEKARLKWTFWHRLADGFVNGITIASAAVPILVLGWKVVNPLAGRTTHADIHINVALGATVALSAVGNLLQAAKGGERRRTIKRQRDRLDAYEQTAGLPAPTERRDLGRRTL